jgi:hypothetical protein
MSKIIGMSRNINLDWLNKVAELYMEGKSEEEINDDLNEYLSLEIKSPTNARKTRNILVNIWVKDNEYTEKAKELAVKLIKSGEKENILLAHWCLMLLTYPVFADICSVIGKMDRKMFDITTKDVKNNMFDLWGERSTLFHSIDKIIKTLKDIGVLHCLPKHKYDVNRYSIESREGIILITYALICIKDKLYLSLEEINNSPEFFPFKYSASIDVLEESNMFSIDKFGGKLVVSNKN